MEKTIYIISGIPRSGTSMMMKMLKEGGLEVFKTTPDEGNEFNPDGYFETSYLKGLNVYTGWLRGVDGKAMKCFSKQLADLPLDDYGKINYKVIYMERDPIASARSMATMKGTEMLPEEAITEKYAKTRQELEYTLLMKPNMEIMYVSYDDVIASPEAKCQEIKNFLGVDLDITKMSAIPDANRRHF